MSSQDSTAGGGLKFRGPFAGGPTAGSTIAGCAFCACAPSGASAIVAIARASPSLLRHSRINSGGGDWTLAHRRWLAGQKFDHAAQQIVFQERIARSKFCCVACVEKQLASSCGVVHGAVAGSLPSMRVASFLVAVTFAAEIGDVRRFDTQRQLASFHGLVPAESSTGDTIRRKGLTWQATGALGGAVEAAGLSLSGKGQRDLESAARWAAQACVTSRQQVVCAPLSPPQRRRQKPRRCGCDRPRDGGFPVGDRTEVAPRKEGPLSAGRPGADTMEWTRRSYGGGVDRRRLERRQDTRSNTGSM